MSRRSGGHGSTRIAIALVLTGLAYVAAGRRTSRRLASLPRVPVITDRRHAGPPLRAPLAEVPSEPVIPDASPVDAPFRSTISSAPP